MNIIDIIIAGGGLALFLYGMKMLGISLEKISGGFLEKILKKLTGNILIGVLTGALVTAVIQSSGATTVIVIGLVNAGLLKLRGAIGIIMGANIGTTITAQILRLSDLESNETAGLLLQLCKPSSIAAIGAIVGILIFSVSKKNKRKVIGEILLGFSILFTGMLTMENAIKPLAEVPEVSNIFANLENPILGIIVGAAVTAILQSSSVSVGILQSLSTTGAITFSSAFPIILGQNIGSCIVSIIAGFGANKNAKRTSAIHLSFNIIGTVLYMIIMYVLVAIGPAWFMEIWDMPVDKGVIANFHTIFNISMTIIMLPFGGMLEKIARFVVKDSKNETEHELDMENLLDERFLSTPSIALAQAEKTIVTMAKYAQCNLRETEKLFIKYDPKAGERITEYENTIDLLDDRINSYLIKLSNSELTAEENRMQTYLLHLAAEFERVGDYAMNLLENAQSMHEQELKFSDDEMREIRVFYSATDAILDMAITAVIYNEISVSKQIAALEDVIDNLRETIKARNIQRFKHGNCGVEVGIVLGDLVTNLERIGDHSNNVGGYIIQRAMPNDYNQHDYLSELHISDTKEYAAQYESFSEKFAI